MIDKVLALVRNDEIVVAAMLYFYGRYEAFVGINKWFNVHL